MKQDKYGLYVPDHVSIPLAHDRAENTTRVYTTKDGKPMIKSEVDQCIKMYVKDFKTKPRTIIIPQTLKEHGKDMEKEFGLVVKLGAARPNQITLTQN